MKSIDIQWRPAEGSFRLTCEQRFAAQRTDVFAFFADAHNLQRITPPWLHFRVLTPHPIEMRSGALIDYRLRLHGLPIRWRTEITDWEPSQYFVDQQLRGPYRLWRHEHFFEDLEDADGTLVRDVVHYRVLGGSLIEKLFVRGDLLKIFDYRRRQMAQVFDEIHSTKRAPADGPRAGALNQ